MDRSSVKAGNAQTEVQSILDQATYHKAKIREHRRRLQICMARVEDVRRRSAEELGFEVVIVPQAHSQEAQSNGNTPRTRT